jgi:hypothetical protein
VEIVDDANPFQKWWLQEIEPFPFVKNDRWNDRIAEEEMWQYTPFSTLKSEIRDTFRRGLASSLFSLFTITD